MFAKNTHALYALAIVILLIVITVCQMRPKSRINLKQLPKNGKQIQRPNNNNNNNNNSGKNNKKKKNSGFLSTKNGFLFYKSRKVFLSGVNILYINLGQDFGNGNYYNVKTRYESYLKQISNAGGNSIRVVVHADGNMTPKLDSEGYATGEDTASLVQEIGLFLDSAKRNNIFVILNLWAAEFNIASDNIKNLFRQEMKLNRYIDKVLKPLVSALKKKSALAMYEVISDPSGSISNKIVDSNPCYDTQDLSHQVSSWTTNNFTMKEMQRFINRHFSAIKSADPKALVTITSKEEESSGLCDWCFNYWQNKCLISAGGKKNGVLDIYTLNAFAYAGEDTSWNPMRKKAADYKLDKPILIGAVSANCTVNSNNAIANFNHAFNNGYAGVLNWRYNSDSSHFCDDSPDVCNSAMSALRTKISVKATIK